jgi:Ca2+-binding RTX toxin-like protein
VSYAPLRRSVHIDLRSGAATGQGRDRLVRIGRAEGSGAADVIDGNGGANRIVGGGGNDVIRGRAGRDFLFGEAGRDQLLGGPNHDWADGGAGDDTCHTEKQTSC